MNWLLRLVVLGAVLVLAGGATAAVGVYQEVTYDCPPGFVLSLDQLGPNESPEATGVPFEDLSPEQQRVFLDAFRDDHGVTDYTPVLDGYVVAYRGSRYRVDGLYVLCDEPAYISQLKRGGTALALGGAAVLMPAIVWHRSESVRRFLQ